ncbi:MAG: hypothetical protein IJ660_00045 [Alphaproteobacteria bacterium]|nr:hypothetical protein [Alphaproteobacteria bacterium]
MIKKIFLSMIVLLLLPANIVNAIPREKEHAECLAKAVSDSAVAQCRETETEAVKAEIKEYEDKIRQEELLQPLVKSADKGIEQLHTYFEKYAESYCLYYVLANRGNGYSDAFNKAKCELSNALQYDDDLISLQQMSANDIKA